MRTLANLLWHIPFCGFMAAIGAAFAGIFLVCTVVGAPIGLGLLQYAKFLLTPFDSHMVDQSFVQKEQTPNPLWKAYSAIVTICWIPFGLLLVCVLIIQGIGMCFTVIGIPNAMVIWKSLGVALNPVSKVCVSHYQFEQVNREKKIANYEVK